MSDSIASLRRKISVAGDLRSVVRTMKAVAASNIGQYEKSVRALTDYYHTVEIGLGACLQAGKWNHTSAKINGKTETAIGVVVFGSDQGMVGQFNDVVADFALKAIETFPAKPKVWAVGERVQARLANANQTVAGVFPVPASVKAITPLIGQILLHSETSRSKGDIPELHLFYNHPTLGASYTPQHQQLLPLDEKWQKALLERKWPTKILPEVMGTGSATLGTFIREYLFVSIFRACAESLSSENSNRLAAMQRADKNIDEMLEDLNGTFHRLRQSGIDEELFDVISGFEALRNGSPIAPANRAGG